MKLSICVLFCDKDCHMAEVLSNKIINSAVSAVDKEVLFLDNRENNHDELHFNKGVKVYKAGSNLYQLQGRKFLVSKATGDYIWFIDADDDIYFVDQDIVDLADKLTYDVIIFSYSYEGFPFKDWKQKEFGPGYPINEKYGAMAWNKWFRRSILEKVETYVSDGLKVIASEDLILVVGASKFSQKSIYVPDILYNFNTTVSVSGCKSIHDIEAFKHIMFGRDDADKIMKTIVGDEYSFHTIFLNDAIFFLYKAGICDQNIQDEALDILEKEFGLELLVEAWKTSQYMMDLKQSYVLWRKMQKKWTDIFDYFAINVYTDNNSILTITHNDGTIETMTVEELNKLIEW